MKPVATVVVGTLLFALGCTSSVHVDEEETSTSMKDAGQVGSPEVGEPGGGDEPHETGSQDPRAGRRDGSVSRRHPDEPSATEAAVRGHDAGRGTASASREHDAGRRTASPPREHDAGPGTAPTPDAGAGASATPCSGPQDNTSCVAPDALCWDEPGKLAPCYELSAPVCYCRTDPCECWGQFGMGAPPYPNAVATPCESTDDETTCLQPGAQCWSVHSDVADDCSKYADPVCDCDDIPCRCWADEESRLTP